jgi:hypothetical protein
VTLLLNLVLKLVVNLIPQLVSNVIPTLRVPHPSRLYFMRMVGI